MLIKTIPVGHLETNCYIVTNENTLECVIIDPGDESNTILDYLEDNRLKCKAIMITHGHYDHTGAADTVAGETGATVYMSKADDSRVMNSHSFVYALPDNGIYFADGDVIRAAGMDFEIMSTPGHSQGSVTIKRGNALFTGDTLFKGSCGRTDLEGGSTEAILSSLRKICCLDGDYEVYPGHMESSSLIREKMLNYYCRLAMSKY